MRIAIAGFSIESCTFSPLISTAADFQVLRGENLLKSYDFISHYADIKFVPILRARALPGGPVARGFYEQIKAEQLAALETNGPWDGIILHMHGAAFVEGMQDAEGDLVAAIRQVVGTDCLMAASYDLHGNVSLRVFDNLDILTAYRTAPHIDWYETLERTCSLLVDCLRQGIRPHKAIVPVPILLSGEQTSTEWEPAQSLYALIPQVIAETSILDASILIGYVWADEPRSTATVLAYGKDPEVVQNAVSRLAKHFWDLRHEFDFGTPAGSVDECIQQALASPASPVVISDSGDNPTAGGAGDVPFVLERLLALNVPDAIFASLPDPAAVECCNQVGVGADVELSVGGKLDPVNGHPLEIRGRVLAVKTLPWSLGALTGQVIDNQIAVMQVQGVKLILTQQRTPFHYIADFQALDIEPSKHKIVVVKIGYLVPELKSLAVEALLALSPGAVNQDFRNLPYQHLQRPMYPFDPNMNWEASN